jgi:hypothetical protein
MRKILLLLGLALVACTDDSATIRTLNDSGYTDIQTTGYSWFECGSDDHYHTGFQAKNPAGKVVNGTVCCGLMFKGCTIRF